MNIKNNNWNLSQKPYERPPECNGVLSSLTELDHNLCPNGHARKQIQHIIPELTGCSTSGTLYLFLTWP